MKLYMKVTRDKYELPLAVADSKRELAEMLGTSINCVYSAYSHGHKTYKVVEIPDPPLFNLQKYLYEDPGCDNDGNLWIWVRGGGWRYLTEEEEREYGKRAAGR